jgi:dolichol-phosphate mannosyltransferase
VTPLVPCPQGALVVPAQLPGPERALGLSLVVPTFNEGKNLGDLVAQLTALLDPELGDDYEIIIVDDDSADRTWELASELAATRPKLRVIRREHERGLSSAVIRGWQIARGQVLAVIDGDLQHPPEITVELWRAIQNGADLAVASRHVPGGGVSDWSLVRRMLSRGAQALGLALLPGVLGRVSDPMSGYFMIRRDVIAGVVLHPLGYKILVEVIGRGHVRAVTEVGYVFRERHEGQSKVTWRVYRDYLRHLARLRAARWFGLPESEARAAAELRQKHDRR